MAEPIDPGVDIGHVHLKVADLDRALDFYCGVLGFELQQRLGDDAAFVSAGGYHHHIGLNTWHSRGGSPPQPGTTGLFHTAIRYPTRRALADALRRLSEAGIQLSGASDHGVSEALYLDDPDGNGVELYWDRPVEEWPPPTADMLVPMATLPVDLDGLLASGRGREAVGESAPAGTDIGHVHLQVSDIDATVRFYVEELGLDLTAKLGHNAGFFSSHGYHHNIGANTWRSLGSKPAGRERGGLERVVLAVTDGNELEGLRERLADSENVSATGDDSLIVHDPDGIELQFINR
jgi:catechol 2,3-dioxygenase